jgi:hypothetical protein
VAIVRRGCLVAGSFVCFAFAVLFFGSALSIDPKVRVASTGTARVETKIVDRAVTTTPSPTPTLSIYMMTWVAIPTLTMAPYHTPTPTPLPTSELKGQCCEDG